MKSHNKDMNDIPFSFENYDDMLGFVITRAGSLIGQKFKSDIVDAGFDITPREFALLNRLHQHGRLNQSQLANLTYKDRPAVTRMLHKLIKSGYVEKLLCDEDRRAFQVSLTAKGKKIRTAIAPIAVNVVMSASQGVSKKDLLTTLNTLQTITAKMGG